MSCLSTDTELSFASGGTIATDEVLREQVWALLAGTYPAMQRLERRLEQRFPFPHLIYLHALAIDEAVHDRALVVVGKDISERGLGFYHRDPIPHRRMIASLLSHDDRWLAFLIDLSWCRFNKHGWYDSGGRLLGAARSPMLESRQKAEGSGQERH